jgi:hypothetical protein
MIDSTSLKEETLTIDQLDAVAGGIIIYGIQQRFTSVLDRVALNPQPLPPKILFGRFGH